MGLLNDDDTKELTARMSATMEKEFIRSIMDQIVLAVAKDVYGKEKAVEIIDKIADEYKKSYIESFEEQIKHENFPFEQLGIDIKEQLNNSLIVFDKVKNKMIQVISEMPEEK